MTGLFINYGHYRWFMGGLCVTYGWVMAEIWVSFSWVMGVLWVLQVGCGLNMGEFLLGYM
jgi:hypothetical protein